MTVRPRPAETSTWRNQRPQVGSLPGSPLSEPGSPRVTGCLAPSSESRALKGRSSTRPVGVAGSTTDSGVRDRLMGPA